MVDPDPSAALADKASKLALIISFSVALRRLEHYQVTLLMTIMLCSIGVLIISVFNMRIESRKRRLIGILTVMHVVVWALTVRTVAGGRDIFMLNDSRHDMKIIDLVGKHQLFVLLKSDELVLEFISLQEVVVCVEFGRPA